MRKRVKQLLAGIRPDRTKTAEIRHFSSQPKGWFRAISPLLANHMVGKDCQL
jgi:hypothetical protein